MQYTLTVLLEANLCPSLPYVWLPCIEYWVYSKAGITRLNLLWFLPFCKLLLNFELIPSWRNTIFCTVCHPLSAVSCYTWTLPPWSSCAVPPCSYMSTKQHLRLHIAHGDILERCSKNITISADPITLYHSTYSRKTAIQRTIKCYYCILCCCTAFPMEGGK